MKKEIWRAVSGYEGMYEVSSLGNVRHYGGKIIGREFSQRGYLRVALYKDGARKRHKVHRLVATAFIPNPFGLPQVDHINGDKTDNRVENLRWVSNIQNCNFDNKAESKTRVVIVRGKEYPSIKAAARSIGVSRYGIMAVLKGTQRTTANGATVSYGEN